MQSLSYMMCMKKRSMILSFKSESGFHIKSFFIRDLYLIYVVEACITLN